MSKDLYAVLGVRRDAQGDEIRSAYRRLAQKYHPDMGAPSAERFVAISEAYEVLGDPDRRRRYDRELAQRTGARAGHGARVEPLRPGGDAVPAPRDTGRDALGLLDELLGELNHEVVAPPRRSQGRGELQVELILDRQEARRGGRFPLHIPLRQCGTCGGSGYNGLFRCPDCRGARVDYHAVEIAIPAGVADGERVRLALDSVGLPGLDLFVTVSVRA